MTWGNLDGRRGPDLFVVQTCEAGRNIRDLVLLDRGPGWDYASGAHVPQASGGCGDLGATLDIDGDGTDEVIVLNGVRGLPPEGGIGAPSRCSRRGRSPDRPLARHPTDAIRCYQAWSSAAIAAWPVHVCPDP